MESEVGNSEKYQLFDLWRRGQDSNLHALSGGGFQDPTRALNLPLPLHIYQYKPGSAAVKVIYVRVQSFPVARHLSANFLEMRSKLVEGPRTAVTLENDQLSAAIVIHIGLFFSQGRAILAPTF